MADSTQGYKLIKVDLAAMRSLSQRLRADGDKLEKLLLSLGEDVRLVGFDWEDDNYARFLLYFLDRYGRPLGYHDFAQDQGEWLDKAIPEYESLSSDVQARIGETLGQFGL